MSKKNKWVDFFSSYRDVAVVSDADLLYQVAITVNGKPVDDELYQYLINDIHTKLDIQSDDIVLDLCCGNGVLTHSMAAIVERIFAVDSSALYIKNAKKFKPADNIEYILADVRKIEFYRERFKEKKLSKILFYGSIAYFNPEEIRQMFESLYEHSTSEVVILIGNVLDKGRRARFYNTFRRRLSYLINVLLLKGNDGVGRWWSEAELRGILDKLGYTTLILPQDPHLHTSHYRFDAIITKKQVVREDISCPTLNTVQP